MDKLIDARFDRVEKALTAVIDSVAKYNPSPSLAEDLVAADKALGRGLLEIEQHQNKYLRILSLRAEASRLDSQIKDVLETLTDRRREMLATPVTVFPEDSRSDQIRYDTHHYPFTYGELMSYARRISRNTMPAPGQTNGAEIFGLVDASSGGDGLGTAPGTAPGTAAATPSVAATPSGGGGSSGGLGAINGIGTPSGLNALDADTPGTATARVVTGTGAASSPHPFSVVAPSNVPDVLPADYQQYVAPTAGTVFLPWPMPDLMGHGALKALQAATSLEKNKTGAVGMAPRRLQFITLEEQEEEERQQAEREAEDREVRQRQMEAEAEAAAAASAMAATRPSGGEGGSGAGYGHIPARPAAPVQFASTLDMDDDD